MLDGQPIPAGDLGGPGRGRARQLPARPGVHRRRRLPRPAGGGAALGLVEPESVARAGGAGAAHRDPDRLRRRGRELRRQGAPGRLGRRVHARRPRRARPQGRVGRAAAAGQAPDQHAGDEGRARADDQHRAELGAADRGAPVRRAAVVDPGAIEGRLLVQPRRVADHPHRDEERAAGDLARRVDAEPGRPRAAADRRQLLPQLGAAGDGARVPVGAIGPAAGGVREHQEGDRGLRRRVHRHADRRHRAAGGADEDADRPQDRGGAGADVRRAARGADQAPGARARNGGREPAERGRAVGADGADRAAERARGGGDGAR